MQADCCSTSDICSGVTGQCGACSQTGQQCAGNFDCCGPNFYCCAGSCSASVCSTCPPNSPTCAATLANGMLANQLCGQAEVDFIAFALCACGTAAPAGCEGDCSSSFCAGQPANQTCLACLETGACMTQYTTCMAH